VGPVGLGLFAVGEALTSLGFTSLRVRLDAMPASMPLRVSMRKISIRALTCGAVAKGNRAC